MDRLLVTYHVRSDAAAIEARARSIAVEQSVEMPVSAIDDADVLTNIVGRVEDIRDLSDSVYAVQISLARETAGDDPGQLLNMLFGNTSIHDDVTLYDVTLPQDLADLFGGPRHGLAGLRRKVGAERRALTCSALKPQGLPPRRLADLARRFAEGGIDYIKDDHGLADQRYSPFAERIPAVAEALVGLPGNPVRYVPSLTGDLDALRAQASIARAAGLDTLMVAPMISGLSNVYRLVTENPDMAFMTHPSMAGAARIAPAALYGTLFRAIGADALVFPNHGGRFGYSPDSCRRIAGAALDDRHGWRPAVPVPAGGMTRERVPEMLEFYGADIMLLIGGGLLEAGTQLTSATAAFVDAVRRHTHG